MSEIKIEAEGNSLLPQERDLKEKLDYPTGKNAEGKADHRYLKRMVEQKDWNDDGDIEENRSDGWCKEMPLRVQNPHAEGEKSHEEEIGENNSVKRNRQLKFFWNMNKTWCDDPNQNRWEKNSEDRKN